MFDAIGSALFAAIGLAIGRVFRDAVADVLTVFEQMGRIGLSVIGAGFVLFLAYKWWERHRFHTHLRMARISPAEVRQLQQDQHPTVMLDVRTALSRGHGGIIPGALIWSDLDRKMATLDLPPGTSVVVYCACPNDASAAVVAKRLMNAGFVNVRPLHGGIEA